ncbi:MAG: Competence protein ComM [candidate division WS2 bacterium]|nr:Competence protein ComM [Candidatus Lithacetigena glycinireducens]
MIAKVLSAAIWGLEVIPIEVEVEVSRGLPVFLIVGLPDQAVQESTERVRSAIKCLGVSFPSGRIVTNMAPADLKKKGPHLDLAIALAILVHEGVLSQKQISNKLFLGELSLSGNLRQVEGVLPVSLSIDKLKASELIVPYFNLNEARLAKNTISRGFHNLKEVVDYLRDDILLAQDNNKTEETITVGNELDFEDIKGQRLAKRALEISSAGGHNVLLIGSPGSGKTLLCRAYPTIMPLLTEEESLEVSKIYSVSGLLKKGSLIKVPPFRSPHHTTSTVALIGGGTIPKPGEVTLAHRGILFLDELTEFRKDSIEALRQPLEDGQVTISRVWGSLTYPSRFTFICAMNPCSCGYYNDSIKPCNCSPAEIKKHRSKISGPIIDRIDINLEVPSLNDKELKNDNPGESSKLIRQRVQTAREIQQERYKNEAFILNSQLNPKAIKKYIHLSGDAKKLLEMGSSRLGLSGRGYDRVLKVATTIADLEGSNMVKAEHIGEALSYRINLSYE